jgi:hypothetical protein
MNPLKTRGEFRCPRRVIGSYSTSSTRRVALVTSPMDDVFFPQESDIHQIRDNKMVRFVGIKHMFGLY